ncbi:MAG: ornithine cyclodeaminase family protein [Sterolibacteriaceae bacterium MAG5]|nr:ornithine cyclodeaminase family protein [Candidatus Nitricoxidireducens bremensis]
MALFLSEADVRQLLTMDLALAAVEEAHRTHALGRAVDVPRQRTRVPTASLHILQGALLDAGVFGYKAYTASREGARFLVHLFDAANGRPLAVLEADTLGMMRTGAAGGVAARYLARQDAATACVFGAGWQAGSQVEALCRVRPIRRVQVCSRNAEKREAFCRKMAGRLGVEMVSMGTAEEALAGADVVVTITTASAPLFDGNLLVQGVHVTAAGSNAVIRRELDEKAIQKASLVCVDSRATALREAGDLLPALEKGRLQEGQLVELGEIVAGIRPGRTDPGQITLFESQGMAIQDIAVAHRILALAKEKGIGQEMPY